MANEDEVLTLEVATPTGLALQTECESVQAPSVHGEFGVLPGHLPLLAALKCGLLKYRTDGHDHVAAVGPGFVEAEPDKVLLLTELFAHPDDVDSERVRREMADAEKKLAESTEREDPEQRELQRSFDWAMARLEAIEHREK